MKYDNQLRYAVNIIREYDGRFPLSIWLKDFFKSNKQMGSTDRKTVAELVYGYFRLGFNQYKNIEERMLAGLFAGNRLVEMIEYFKSGKDHEFSIDKIFPWSDLLSDGIDHGAFCASFLIQPDLFLRVRPGKENEVGDKLKAAGIEYTKYDGGCVALPNATTTGKIIRINEEAVVQDKSSQQTGYLLKNIFVKDVWDCCAASGGKTIMVHDLFNEAELTVSDKRESIISNLKVRFKEAGINKYHSFITNLSDTRAELPDWEYDLIIADVPCSGSGTWSRTPEQLCFFKPDKISYYTGLQQQIVSKALTKLTAGGHFLYITCSVFRQENEDMVQFILSDKSIRLIKKELIKGYTEKADTLFAAIFTNAPAAG